MPNTTFEDTGVPYAGMIYGYHGRDLTDLGDALCLRDGHDLLTLHLYCFADPFVGERDQGFALLRADSGAFVQIEDAQGQVIYAGRMETLMPVTDGADGLALQALCLPQLSGPIGVVLAQAPMTVGIDYATAGRPFFIDEDGGWHWIRPPQVMGIGSGTQIRLMSGERAVDTLAPGDLVWTADHGPMGVQWVGQTEVPLAEAETDMRHWSVHFLPGLIAGHSSKEVFSCSPDHRVVLRSDRARVLFGSYEVLVAARDLTSLRGVRLSRPRKEQRFFQIVLESHAVISANGALCESQQLCEDMLFRLPYEQSRTLCRVMPASARDMQPVRPVLNNAQVQDLLRQPDSLDVDLAAPIQGKGSRAAM